MESSSSRHGRPPRLVIAKGKSRPLKLHRVAARSTRINQPHDG